MVKFGNFFAILLIFSPLLGTTSCQVLPETVSTLQLSTTALPTGTPASTTVTISGKETQQHTSPSQTPTPILVHAEAKDTFIYFSTCFDLDEGRRSQRDDPICDFIVHACGEAASLEFVPIFPAAFDFASQLTRPPTLEECSRVSGMSSEARVFQPRNNYLCYQTQNGRFGFLTFKSIEPTEGVTFDWRTYEAARLRFDPLSRREAAEFVEDVTVPDGTEFEPGEHFTKVWRLRNVSEVTWTPDYTLVFDSGDPMGKTISVAIGQEVPPGEMVDIAIELTAPLRRGVYTGWWKLRNPQGVRFGVGKNADQPIYVIINVIRTAVYTPTPVPQTATP